MTGVMAGEFKLSEAVPWGRNRVEYLAFFDLLDLAPGTTILDCAASPASFNGEMTRLGYKVVSADPLYGAARSEIAARIADSRQAIMAGLRQARDRFLWRDFGTPDDLEATRLSAMKHFLEDYDDGLAEGRYLDAALPDLPFEAGAFDLALSSHFLFTYSVQFGREFHLNALLEMARVAREVRIFPLLDLDGELSAHVTPLRQALEARGFATEIRRVAYEFQKGGDRMLRIAPD
jgi:hypothetical protein